MDVDPDSRRVEDWLRSSALEFDPSLSPVEVRRRLERLAAESPPGRSDVDVTEIALDAARETGRSLLVRPSTAVGSGALVWFHGGGWSIGSPRVVEGLATRLAVAIGAAVILPAYRLAPEHPFPAAVEDAVGAYATIVDRARALSLSFDRIVIGGDSAGANLAAVVALEARPPSRVAPAGQVLVCPAVDARLDRESARAYENDPFLSREAMQRCLRLYAAGADPDDWRLSPLRAPSHRGTAPALVVTAGCDLLGAQGRAYVEALARSDVAVEHRHHPTMFHGFFGLDELVPAAAAAFDEVVTWVRARLSIDETEDS